MYIPLSGNVYTFYSKGICLFREIKRRVRYLYNKVSAFFSYLCKSVWGESGCRLLPYAP